MNAVSANKIRYAKLHLLRIFFEGMDQWEGKRALAGIASSLTKQEYDDLFRGTNMSVYVPVWASACKYGKRTILDDTTLAVVERYYENGYSPAGIDHNPPDYIGEQLRFLEYLAAAGLNGDDTAAALEAMIDEFTLDTAKALSDAARKYSGNSELEAVLDLLMDALTCGKRQLSLSEGDIAGFDSFSWRKNPLIPSGEVKVTSHASFNDCGSKCKMLSRSKNGCVVSIESDNSDPEMPFTGCPRGRAYRNTFLTVDRLRYPMERIGERGEGRFRRISWDEATDKIAEAIRSSREKYGVASRFVLPAAGVLGLIRGDSYIQRLLILDGGFLKFYNFYSASCALHITPYVYGTVETGNSLYDVLNTKLLIFWGYNPAVNHYGPFRNHALMQAKEKGIKIIVIDPRRSDTAVAYADEWIPINPSSDSALADAMCYVIYDRGLDDREFTDRFCVGFDEEHMPEGVPYGESYHSYLFGVKDGVKKAPQWAEGITGVPAETIERLAIEYATAKPACLMPGFGPQRTLNGEQAFYNFMALACLTGNVGKAGGSSGASSIRKSHVALKHKLPPNPYGGAIPSFRWTAAADQPEKLEKVKDGLIGIDRLETGIKLIFCLASGMLVNQHSNINDTLRILRTPGKVDTVVVSDVFMTPSAAAADILLPATSFFETDNICGPWITDDYFLYNHRAISPVFDSRFEYDWITDVAKKLGFTDEFTQKLNSSDEWLRMLYDQRRPAEPEMPEFDEFYEKSFCLFKTRPYIVAFRENVEDGAPFNTPSGKIEIFSKRIYDMDNHGELPGRPGYTPCEEGPDDTERRKRYPLQLIGYHTRRRCHSIHENNVYMEELEPPALWINPKDAAARDISDNDLVEVFNDRGTVRIKAKVTDRITGGVIAMSEGAWHRPDKDGVDTRGSINVLTFTHKATPLAKANPQHTNLADVRKYVPAKPV